MSVLTENYDPQGKAGALISYPVAGGVHIFKGALVCVNADGYAQPADDAEGLVFAGVAYEECDNTSESDGDGQVRVLKTGSFLYAKDSPQQSDMGALMFATDDQTVSPSTDHSIPVGYVVEVPPASVGGRLRIRIDTQVR